MPNRSTNWGCKLLNRRKGRKTYVRSESCEIANTTVTYNIRDERDGRLLQFADSLPNYGGTVKGLLDVMQRLDVREPEDIYGLLISRPTRAVESIQTLQSIEPSTSAKKEETRFDPVAALF